MPIPHNSVAPVPVAGAAVRRALAALTAIVTLLLAIGCGLLGAQATQPTGPNPRNLERPTLRVGSILSAGAAPLRIAIAKGYFEQEGLHVVPATTTGGGQAIPQLSSGDLDLTTTNDATAIAAQLKQAPELRFVFDCVQATPNSTVLTALPDSGINTIGDLAGRRVGVSTLNDLVMFALYDVLRANNIDPKTINFVVVPYANSEEALRTHQVDAVAQNEPYLTESAQHLSTRRVVDVFSGQGPNSNLPIAAYVATAKLAGSAPRSIAAFQRAMVRAARDAADRDEVERILPSYLKLDSATTKLMTLPGFPTTLNPVRLQRVADLMLSYGELRAHYDVGPMIVPVPVN